MYVKRRWRQAQYLANVFWRRWIREYLTRLAERQKWIEKKKNLCSGDIVLVADENVHRGQWPLGRVLETFPDHVGLVRSVRIKVGDNTMIRPIHLLSISKICLESMNL